jgi:hypothetical protein
MEHLDGRCVHTFQLVSEWLSQGKLRVDSIKTREFALDDYRRAIRCAHEKRGSAVTKVLFRM